MGYNYRTIGNFKAHSINIWGIISQSCLKGPHIHPKVSGGFEVFVNTLIKVYNYVTYR